MIQMNILIKQKQGFPGGAVVENLPANAGDTGSSPGLGRSHMPWSNWAREPQLLSLRSARREAAIVRGPRTAMKSGPHLPQLEKALAQKRRPNTAINKLKKKKKFLNKKKKIETDSVLENKLMVTGGGGIDWEFGIDMHTAIFKIDNQEGPTV